MRIVVGVGAGKVVLDSEMARDVAIHLIRKNTLWGFLSQAIESFAANPRIFDDKGKQKVDSELYTETMKLVLDKLNTIDSRVSRIDESFLDMASGLEEILRKAEKGEIIPQEEIDVVRSQMATVAPSIMMLENNESSNEEDEAALLALKNLKRR